MGSKAREGVKAMSLAFVLLDFQRPTKDVGYVGRFVLLKLIQKFGKPERFDFMYHVSGPEKGRPKGYCFVTYPSKEVRQSAR